MAIALVQSATGIGTTATTNPSFSSAPTSGNLIVLGFASADYNGTPDTGWTQSANMETQGFHGGYIWWRISNGSNPPGGYTIGSAIGSAWVLAEFSGCDAVPYDTSTSSFANTSVQTWPTTTIVPSTGNRVVVVMVGGSITNTSAVGSYGAWTNSFIAINSGGNSGVNNNCCGMAYRLVVGNGSTSFSTTGDFTGTISCESASGLLISFKEAAGGTTTTLAAAAGSYTLTGTPAALGRQIINIGAAPNDGTGDPARVAFDKCNRNFSDLYTADAAFLTTVTAAATYQPLDADLTAIAALTGTNTIYYRSAANTWSPVNVSTGLSFSGGTLANTVAAGGNVSNSGTPVAGQVAEWVTATTIQGVSTYAKLTDVASPQCGRLSYVSATALSFIPYLGDRIRINGTVFAIPSGGITGLANTSVFVNGTGGQNLAANTLYYVYAFNNSGTVTADFSTTVHATSSTAGNVGTEIKSADNTRSLIGLIRTNPSSQFQNDTGNRFVISWFNRRNLAVQAPPITGVSTTSTTFIELATAGRGYFLAWAGEDIMGGIFGAVSATVTTFIVYSGWMLDGVHQVATSQHIQVAGSYQSACVSSWSNIATEVLHYLTPSGAVSANTGFFDLTAAGMTRG